jgi:CDP-diacylglycerol--glycerol-3-phosphate 3-phosphatidyltransferase
MANTAESLVVRLVPESVTPNILTWVRIIAVPIIWVTYMLSPLIALVVYVFACVTDFLDGKVARERGLCSSDGKRLDEVADKFLTVGVLVVLFADNVIAFSLTSFSFWVVVSLVTRELAVSAMRSMWSERAGKIPSLMLAKIKTGILMVSFGFLMYSGGEYLFREQAFLIGMGLMWVALVCSLVSWWQYSRLFLEQK